MKTKKFLLPSIFLAVMLIIYVIASIAFCYTTKPAVRTGEFPFSITYEYMGETKTISGVYACKFGGSRTIFREHDRFWAGEIIYTEGDYIVFQEKMKTLAIQPNMEAGYFMGDPLYRDYYQVYGLEAPKPYVEYYDYENDIAITDHDQEEELATIGFRFIDFSYGEPIENSFSFSGIRYEADNISVFVIISLLFFLACLIFVRKDKAYTYTDFDKVGIILNFLVGILAIPFITIICFFFGIIESNTEIINQIVYNMPTFAILCLTLSIVFRRKGCSKTGFFIQFIGIVPFVLMLVADAISQFC